MPKCTPGSKVGCIGIQITVICHRKGSNLDTIRVLLFCTPSLRKSPYTVGFFGFSRTNCCPGRLFIHSILDDFQPFTAKIPSRPTLKSCTRWGNRVRDFFLCNLHITSFSQSDCYFSQIRCYFGGKAVVVGRKEKVPMNDIYLHPFLSSILIS